MPSRRQSALSSEVVNNLVQLTNKNSINNNRNFHDVRTSGITSELALRLCLELRIMSLESMTSRNSQPENTYSAPRNIPQHPSFQAQSSMNFDANNNIVSNQFPLSQHPNTVPLLMSTHQSRAPLIPPSIPYMPVQSIQHHVLPSQQSITNTIPIPPDLVNEVSDPKFQPVLLNIKEQTGINLISIKRDASNLPESIYIDGPDHTSCLLAKNLVEFNFKQNLKLKEKHAKLCEAQTTLYRAQGNDKMTILNLVTYLLFLIGEMASGMTIEFYVKPHLLGFVIGKQGSKINDTKQTTGVSNINVNGETGLVIIFGPSMASVQQARDLLEVDEETHSLSEKYVIYYLRESALSFKNSKSLSNTSLMELKETSGLFVARIERSTNEIVFIGTKSSLNAGKVLLMSQVYKINLPYISYNNFRCIVL